MAVSTAGALTATYTRRCAVCSPVGLTPGHTAGTVSVSVSFSSVHGRSDKTEDGVRSGDRPTFKAAEYDQAERLR